MKLAHVVDGVVVNVILVDPEDIPEWCFSWPVCDDAGPGWLWDGVIFAPPVEIEQEN